jgi:hypothetical protein
LFWLEKIGMASGCEINKISLVIQHLKLYDCLMTIF